MVRQCAKCGSSMERREDYSRPRWQCQNCDRERSKATPRDVKAARNRKSYQKTGKKIPSVHYRKRIDMTQYGLTEDQAVEIRKIDKCQSCGEPQVGRLLSIDHDHSCCPGKNSCGRCIRGVLCAGCNLALGLLKDDPKRVESLLIYLKSGRIW